jgi:hypothetical protein
VHQRLLVGGDQVVGLARLAAGIADARRRGQRPEAEPGHETRGHRPQLLERGEIRRFGRRAGVIGVELAWRQRRALHEADALPLHGVGDDHLRHVGDRVERAEGALERRHVVPVDPADVPSERAQLGLEVAEVADLPHPGVGLDLVVVDDGDDLAESAVGGRSERLPELPFLQLPVTRQHEDAPRPPGQPVGDRHPLRLRDAHAERAGVGLHVRRLDVRMPGQPVQAAQLVQHVGRQQAEPDEHVVQRRGVVPLRREEEVGLPGPFLQVAHLVEEQPAHDLQRAEAGADVPRPGAGDHVERVQPRQRGEGFDARHGGRVGGRHAPQLGRRDEEQLEALSLIGLDVTHAISMLNAQCRMLNVNAQLQCSMQVLDSQPLALLCIGPCALCLDSSPPYGAWAISGRRAAPSTTSRSAIIQSYGSLTSNPSCPSVMNGTSTSPAIVRRSKTTRDHAISSEAFWT